MFKTSHRLRLVSDNLYFKCCTAVTSIGGRCIFRSIQTCERASHRWGPCPLCSGADPSSDPIICSCRRFRDLPCRPRLPGDGCYWFCLWPTPGPAKSSEPAIIRLWCSNTSCARTFSRLFDCLVYAIRINDLLYRSRSVGRVFTGMARCAALYFL